MDITQIIMYVGFAMAAYSVVGNDVIQTLGTFIASNENKKWYVLWGFSGSILAATLIYGWATTMPERAVLTDHYVELTSGEYEGLYVDYTQAKAATQKTLFYPSEFSKQSEKLATADFETLHLYKAKDADATAFEVVDSIQARTNPNTVFSLEIQTPTGPTVAALAAKQVHDVSYQRLEKYDYPLDIAWWYLLPPLVLLIITRTGIPVSTSFLILTFFNPKNLQSMALKSLMGYIVAFSVAAVVYILITKRVEKRFAETPMEAKTRRNWTIAQWTSTGFLWSQWLIQDFANIYVYLPRDVSLTTLAVSLVVILGLLAYIFYTKGGAIQGIVRSKSNTTDIRSATIVDLIYGIVLFFFKELSNIPMSTTWVFIGLLAGREYAIRYMLDGKMSRRLHRMALSDLGKVALGLVISVLLVLLIKEFQQFA